VCACASDYIFSTESVRWYTCSIDGYCIKCWCLPKLQSWFTTSSFFLFISKDSKIKHLISKCQWHHLESKVSLIMRLPDVGSSESCFDWLYNNPRAYTLLNWPTVHFFFFPNYLIIIFFYFLYYKRSYDDQESFWLKMFIC